MKRKISNLVIAIGLIALIVCVAFYCTHRVPVEAPFLTSTVCVSMGATPDHLVQLLGSPQYNLLVGVFGWQRSVRPKYGYVIFDEKGKITHWDENLWMVRGRYYSVHRTDIHGNAAKPTPVAYINAV